MNPVLRRAVVTLRDLAPIVLVIAFFQIVVLQQPFPNLGNVLIGLLCVCVGLALFVQGLESGLFPLGEVLARGVRQQGEPDRPPGLRFLPRFRRDGRRAGADRRRRRGRRGCVGGRRNRRQRSGPQFLRTGTAPCRGGRRWSGHRAGSVAHPERLAHPPPDHCGLLVGHRHDPRRTRRNNRHRLRLRRGYDQHHHRTLGSLRWASDSLCQSVGATPWWTVSA